MAEEKPLLGDLQLNHQQDGVAASAQDTRQAAIINRAPGKVPMHVTARQRDKLVPLPDEKGPVSGVQDHLPKEASTSVHQGAPGRITAYCIAEALNRKLLEVLLAQMYPEANLLSYPDVLQLSLGEPGSLLPKEVFFFDYGVVISFGLEEKQEQWIMQNIGVHVECKPYLSKEVEIDEFKFLYTGTKPPCIQNDVFTMSERQAKSHEVRLAISYALAQSIKLSVYEGRVLDLVEETRRLPEALAKQGRVPISTKRVAQLIGKVFLQNANVNLLSSVLGTPAYFWSAPDQLQALYERACEYLELQSRVEVLNARFQVLQEMLDMLRDHQNNSHASRLELIIVWLLVVDCCLMLCQLLSLFGVIGGD
ncbi:hypothetical protein DUNSADRAFT_1131 [Dunaliella salina]|uniref:DUF155 domain-containing protein n=1 Tax=Dunaliella salina TaxID=3046 RepID=A0ABQ7FXZ2_DUNSA|nr:hypothetical protein DUNSADRAFT_1131 [Dunaliella salina]|eukprot:KAF5827211.1 hypothetical protein DUNSADRAFT_1131 [Dunaliella salina]